MVKPGLILMDEPSIGLSPRMIDEVYTKITEINLRGATFAIVEQNANKALGIAHRGYVLDLGGPASRTRERGFSTTKRSRNSTSGDRGKGPGYRVQGTDKDLYVWQCERHPWSDFLRLPTAAR